MDLSKNEVENIINEMIGNIVEEHFYETKSKDLENKNKHLQQNNSTLLTSNTELKQKIIELETQIDILSKFKETIIKTEALKEQQELEKQNRTPEIVFIVPYRDRAPQRTAFIAVMKDIVAHLNCKIIFVHQRDSRPFNRGAIKNLGFLYVKNTYPEAYRNITLVFNDIDYMPWFKDQFTFNTEMGSINHFYGFKRGLGGIFAIKGQDFEELNGFPNYWSWGLEDNVLRWRAGFKGKQIIYPQFISSDNENKNIIGLWHGWERNVEKNMEFRALYRTQEMREGITSLYNVNYNTADIVENNKLFIEVNIVSFETGEGMNSKYVRNIQKIDARKTPRLNEYQRVKQQRGRNRRIGVAGRFGKGKKFGSMVMF